MKIQNCKYEVFFQIQLDYSYDDVQIVHQNLFIMISIMDFIHIEEKLVIRTCQNIN